MDWVALRKKMTSLFRKYQYVFLILAVGLLLMGLPGTQKKEEPVQQNTAPAAPDSSEKLAQILSQIDGVGKVRVFLTEAAGAQTVYQTDRDENRTDTTTSVKLETVIVSDSSRAQSPLVKQVIPPVYLGAIIVCQGAGSASVRLAVAQAVSNVTGIGTDRIAVLKMK